MVLSKLHTARGHFFHGLMSAGFSILIGWSSSAFAAAPPVPISQIPLTITIPAHPQIVLAMANSQSMDGNLSGAILAGSGSLAATYAGLNASSSPLNFTIPAGFTPPVAPGAGGIAPFTVTSGGNLVDNSPSRLNVAKAGIKAILQSYITSADFALLDYKTSGIGRYGTWVYQMSPPGGFVFTDTPGASRFVTNPCYNVNTSNTDKVASDCKNLKTFYGSTVINKPYMLISASSDDPSINDVLYDTGSSAVCVGFGGPAPATPYPPNFSLLNYNNGGILETYTNSVNACALQTGPTNAGFVPFSTQVMYEYRGFGFYSGSETANTATTVVPLTSTGATPTAATVATALGAFAPSLAPETNSTGTSEIKASGLQAPTAGLIAGAQTFFAATPSSTSGCSAQRYVILLTDGLPTMDLAGKAWPPLGSASAAGYGVTATFNGDGSLAATNDQALTDTIANLAALKTAGVTTYVIGLGAGVNPLVNPTAAQTLTAMAVAGGSGAYFAATDPTTLANDLQSILGTILAATQSVASVAVNSTGLNTSTVIYQAQFSSADSYQDWTGNFFAFPVNASTGAVDTLPAHAQWSSQAQLDSQNVDTGRKIATWDPVTNAGTPFRWTANAAATSGIAPNTGLGLSLQTFASDTNGQDVVNYLRGSSAQEVRNGGFFRNRAHRLGDIVFSNPIYVGPPSSPNLSGSYVSFAAAHASRPGILYVGGDDGMLHAFDATTGAERFAFIPNGVFPNLIKLVSPFYNAQHRFFVDGSPRQVDVQFSDSTWHTLVLGTEGAGGNDVFAIDVSDPTLFVTESALASAVLWDFTDADMGNSFSVPTVANTSSGNVILIGNGYNSVQGKPFLYSVSAQTGNIIRKIDLCAAVPTACNLGVANGLSTVIAVNSSGQATGIANLAYAGDLQGNLWRIDISNVNPALWTVSVMTQARDPSGNPQPITTAPVATLNPRYPQVPGTMVFFATGELLGAPDQSSSQVQSIYGVYDPPAPYATPLVPPSPRVAPTAASSLVQQVLSAATVGTNAVSVVTGNAVSIPTNKGWFIDLALNSGERVVNDMQLRSGALIVDSYQPSGSACGGVDSSYLYVINFATGGSFPSPQFDANGDGSIDQGDTAIVAGSHVVPLGERLGNGYYSRPTIISDDNPTGRGINYIAIVCGENGVCKPVPIRGPLKHRTAWWEVRQ